jgi:hypothetical protein
MNVPRSEVFHAHACISLPVFFFLNNNMRTVIFIAIEEKVKTTG